MILSGIICSRAEISMEIKKAVSKRIGEILIEEGFLNPKDLETALEIQKKEGGLIGAILVRIGAVKEENLVLGLSKQLAIPYIRLHNYSINQSALTTISKEAAERHLLFPFEKDERSLSVAVSDPLDKEAEAFLEKCVPLRLNLFLATVSDIKAAIELHYTKQSPTKKNRGLAGKNASG